MQPSAAHPGVHLDRLETLSELLNDLCQLTATIDYVAADPLMVEGISGPLALLWSQTTIARTACRERLQTLQQMEA